jgi:hypothetical protein
MMDVQDQIDRRIGKQGAGETTGLQPTLDFMECSKRWAAYCLETHLDTLLRKGLALAAALAEYDAELKGDVPKP